MDTSLDQERLAHLRKLRAIHRRNLDQLEEDEALCGGAVPLALANQLAETRETLRTLDAALASPVSASLLAELGPEGQTQVVDTRLRRMQEQQALHDTLDSEERQQRQAHTDHWFRRIWYALIGIMALLTLLIVIVLTR